MKEAIEQIQKQLAELKAASQKEVEDARVRLLGKKGSITALMEEFRTIAPELKREYGQKLNELKKAATAKIEELKEQAAAAAVELAPKQDLSMPGDPFELGSRHPVSIVRQEIVDIFRKFGYDVAEGPEIEDDWHVFEALNFPPNHPAREMQDTFFVSNGHLNPLLLRTHTSSVQVRTMESQPLPIRVICPGRVFRNEAISARAHCIFHQVEGLYIDKNVTFADLKQAILLGHPPVRPRNVRPGHADPDAPFLFPVHRALRGGRRELQHLPRKGLQHLQGYRLARDHGLRHGGPERPRGQRHRLQGL